MRRIAGNAANPRECRGTARARMFRRFQHQKRCHAAKDQPARIAARGNRRVIALPQHATWRIKQHHIPALRRKSAAHQSNLSAPFGKPRRRDANRISSRFFFPHQRARRSRHAMHDRDIAGEQIGKLR